MSKSFKTKQIALVFMAVLACQNSLAWKLGDPIGKVISDGAADLEKGVQNLGKAAADVVTLGEDGRRRDEENAQHEKQVAEEKRKATEALKTEKLKSIDLKIFEEMKLNDSLGNNIHDFQILENFLKVNIKNINFYIKSYKSLSLQYSAEKSLIFNQFDELKAWVSSHPESQQALSHDSVSLIDINKKISVYMNEINNIPQNSEAENFDDLVDKALEAGLEVLAEVDQQIAKLNAEKKDSDQAIAIATENRKTINQTK